MIVHFRNVSSQHIFNSYPQSSKSHSLCLFTLSFLFIWLYITCGVGDASAFHLVLFWVWLWNLAGDCFSLGCACFYGLLIGIVVIGFTLGLTLFDTDMNKIIPPFLHTFSTFSTYFSTFYSLFNIPKRSPIPYP